MNNLQDIPDAEQRYRALDPTQSFIVQAPAGSGKTALLIQRYLKLLACVDAPEEIVAITFTRKAAAEMRTRVLAALAMEWRADDPDNSYERLNRELVQSVLQRDRQAGWQLIENPGRLRIQTIDSFCAALTRQMPVLTKFGAQPEIVDDASDCYLEAARATLALLNHPRAMIAIDVERLLEHLDNDNARAEALLAEMLARRDHWLRHILDHPREELEIALQSSRQYALNKVIRLFPAILRNELSALTRYATANLIASNPITEMSNCDMLASSAEADIQQWQNIASLLLTKDGSWRKKVTSREGFPTGDNTLEKEQSSIWKKRFATLMELLATEDVLQQALQDIRQLPPPHYSDRQWEILGAIVRLLPYAVAQLKVIFQVRGVVDFSEVAQRASVALGTPDAPTDLALALDYQINHLMIDEFQDTSISQFALLEKLVAGWQDGDGRSLFIVGDPMQSIYRFREAEVGLFLRVKNQGIGSLALQSVTLSTNFRSQHGIVDWVNMAFGKIMSYPDDSAVGAVAYTPSVAVHSEHPDSAVTVYPTFSADFLAESNQVVEIIQQTRKQQPNDTIAILVRNRSHLIEIVAQIKAVGLRFRAVDIELLQHKSAVQDLLVLTRALVDPADRLAWCALLRAPFCGLLLSDIAVLVESGAAAMSQSTIGERVCNEAYWVDTSPDAQMRLRRICSALRPCMENRQRQSLRITVEAVWHMLGGANAACGNVNDALIYLNYLESKETAGEIQDWVGFEQGLSNLFASPDLEANDVLQIMTIHKAKGLEFDTVIVPGLGRTVRGREKQLLRWMEQPRDQTVVDDSLVSDLIFAPIPEIGIVSDSIYAWLEKLEGEKEAYETDRLLYVAATRAKKKIFLLGHVGISFDAAGKGHPKEPLAGTLLRRLWPIVRCDYSDAASKLNTAAVDEIRDSDTLIRSQIYRLKSDWVLPDASPSVFWQKLTTATQDIEEIEYSWAGETVRYIGIVAHRWLQQIAEHQMKGWCVDRIQKMRDQFRKNLLAIGMIGNKEEIEHAVQHIIRVLINAVTDQRGQWILGPQPNAQNELKITGLINNQPMNWVIDRTFCDVDGFRWIIDYKTGGHEGTNAGEFLDREQIRYQKQLDQYAKLMLEIDSRPIKVGLYFPAICGWRCW